MSLRKCFLYGSIFSGLLLLTLGTGKASAELLVELASATQVGSEFQYDYRVRLVPTQQINNGDFFTIYDFEGFLAGSNAQPTGWDFVSQLAGVNPPMVNPPDDSNIPNVTWTYTGSSPLTAPTGVMDPIDVGVFSSRSSLDTVSLSNVAYQTHQSQSGPIPGAQVNTITSAQIPRQGGVAIVPQSTPEPRTVVLLTIGLVGMVFCGARRRKVAS
jgi:hypothetical protein